MSAELTYLKEIRDALAKISKSGLGTSGGSASGTVAGTVTIGNKSLAAVADMLRSGLMVEVEGEQVAVLEALKEGLVVTLHEANFITVQDGSSEVEKSIFEVIKDDIAEL